MISHYRGKSFILESCVIMWLLLLLLLLLLLMLLMLMMVLVMQARLTFS